ncbi:MAG: nucleotidyltransferase [Candidatus Tectomicrobia bacterium]|nr:nucleotidyltransferase [Candidatus Tectomicrobia bacterium]
MEMPWTLPTERNLIPEPDGKKTGLAEKPFEYLTAEERYHVLVETLGTIRERIDRMRVMSQEEHALLDMIHQAEHTSDLRAAHDRLNQLVLEDFLEYFSAAEVNKRCTTYRDQIVKRVATLVEWEMKEEGLGKPPVKYAWLGVGSEGREEQTLLTDQDNLIIYEDHPLADQYFLEFSTKMVNKLEEAGFAKCTGDIMPTNERWRGSLTQWKRRIKALMYGEARTLDLIILTDARFIVGEVSLAGELIHEVSSLFKSFIAFAGIARSSLVHPVALNLFKQFKTEWGGTHKGQLNIKLVGWAPLVMAVRTFSLREEIMETNTVARIMKLKEHERFDEAFANRLKEAYRILTKNRILQQIEVMKMDKEREYFTDHDYFIDPYTLPSDEQQQLKEALWAIKRLQKMILKAFYLLVKL